jgi:hypothetical protein
MGRGRLKYTPAHVHKFVLDPIVRFTVQDRISFTFLGKSGLQLRCNKAPMCMGAIMIERNFISALILIP